MCLPAACADLNRAWAIDSGSCVHLVRADELTEEETSRIQPVKGGPENLITANGPTEADREVSVRIGSCDSSATALVLDDSPSVPSLGASCQRRFLL